MMFLLYLELFAQPGKHWVSSGIAFCASSIANTLVIALPIINIKCHAHLGARLPNDGFIWLVVNLD